MSEVLPPEPPGPPAVPPDRDLEAMKEILSAVVDKGGQHWAQISAHTNEEGTKRLGMQLDFAKVQGLREFGLVIAVVSMAAVFAGVFLAVGERAYAMALVTGAMGFAAGFLAGRSRTH